jgi:hypothetical protein
MFFLNDRDSKIGAKMICRYYISAKDAVGGKMVASTP